MKKQIELPELIFFPLWTFYFNQTFISSIRATENEYATNPLMLKIWVGENFDLRKGDLQKFDCIL